MYLIFDEYSEYTDIRNYKQLKELLIDELEEEISNNADDKDIIKNNFKIMRDLTSDKFNDDLIIKELKGFGWNIIDLTDLKNNLMIYKEYKNSMADSLGKNIQNINCIEQIIKMIENER